MFLGPQLHLWTHLHGKKFTIILINQWLPDNDFWKMCHRASGLSRHLQRSPSFACFCSGYLVRLVQLFEFMCSFAKFVFHYIIYDISRLAMAISPPFRAWLLLTPNQYKIRSVKSKIKKLRVRYIFLKKMSLTIYSSAWWVFLGVPAQKKCWPSNLQHIHQRMVGWLSQKLY